MTSANHEPLLSEMRELLAALREDTLTDQQAQRLQTLLSEHESAREIYLEYANQAAGLRSYATDVNFSDEAGDAEAAIMLSEALLRQRLQREASPITMRITRWALAASVLIAVGLGAALWVTTRPATDDMTADLMAQATQGGSVAVLSRAVEAQWASNHAMHVGDALPAGPIVLNSGLAQIEFFSGATVVLEGPAHLELISPDRGIVHSGKVRAHVPVPAHGFTLATADMDIVDLGTEFGLNVTDDGEAEVHVFDGEVELHGPQSDMPRNLTTGHGLRRGANGAMQVIDVDDNGFVSAARLAERAENDRSQRAAAWWALSEQIAADPSVVLYYNFQNQPTWQRTLIDRRVESHGERDGAIVGCTWAPGRWPGKSALGFKRLSDRVRVQIDGEYESLTLAAWVRFDALDRWLSSLMLTDAWASGNPHWHVSREGEMMLGVGGSGGQDQSGRSGVPNHNYNTPTHQISSEDLGRWVYLATVYDGPAGVVTHYLDGRPVSHEKILGQQTLRLGPTAIGNWSEYTGPANQARTLNGLLDEFVIFSRPLGADEIRAMYEAGKP